MFIEGEPLPDAADERVLPSRKLRRQTVALAIERPATVVVISAGLDQRRTILAHHQE